MIDTNSSLLKGKLSYFNIVYTKNRSYEVNLNIKTVNLKQNPGLILFSTTFTNSFSTIKIAKCLIQFIAIEEITTKCRFNKNLLFTKCNALYSKNLQKEKKPINVYITAISSVS